MIALNSFKRILGQRYDLSGPLLQRKASQAHQVANMSEKSDVEKVEILWDEERKRFRTPDAKAYLSYTLRPSGSPEQKPDVLDLQHTFVPASFRGQGVAARLCETAFQHAKDKGLLVQPTCSYVSDTFLPRNSKWNNIVVEGKRSGL